jgi:hypothetical protein
MVGQRLQQELHGARLHRQDRHWNVAFRRHDNDRRLPALGGEAVANLRAKLQALGAGNGESYVEILGRRGLSELIMRVGMAMF